MAEHNFYSTSGGPRGRPNKENRSRDKQGAQPGKPNRMHFYA